MFTAAASNGSGGKAFVAPYRPEQDDLSEEADMSEQDGTQSGSTNQDGQGQNRLHTPGKLKAIRAAIGISLKTSLAPTILDFPYWLSDLNAGSGWNVLPDCPGSPLVLRE